MLTLANMSAQEVRKRAAEIRGHWTSLERLHRTGLPPDVPARLRNYILGRTVQAWPSTVRMAVEASKGIPVST